MNLSKTYSLLVVVAALLIALPSAAQVSREGSSAFYIDPSPKVEIYPNPATEFIRLKMEIEDHKQVKISVHNIIGNPIEVEMEVTTEQVVLNIKDLPSGYYLLSLKTENPHYRGTYKFLKR